MSYGDMYRSWLVSTLKKLADKFGVDPDPDNVFIWKMLDSWAESIEYDQC